MKSITPKNEAVCVTTSLFILTVNGTHDAYPTGSIHFILSKEVLF